MEDLHQTRKEKKDLKKEMKFLKDENKEWLLQSSNLTWEWWDGINCNHVIMSAIDNKIYFHDGK